MEDHGEIMAKKPKPSKTNKSAQGVTDNADDTGQTKLKSSRGMLVAAIFVTLASLSGGVFLAQYAFKKDAAEIEPAKPSEEGSVATDSANSKIKIENAHKKVSEGERKKPSDGAGNNAMEEQVGVLDFNSLITNISGLDANGNARQNFLKLSIALVYKGPPEAKALMDERKPFMRDLFNTYIRGLTEADVRGGIGILTIKSELLKRARAAVGNDMPREILIKDLIVN